MARRLASSWCFAVPAALLFGVIAKGPAPAAEPAAPPAAVPLTDKAANKPAPDDAKLDEAKLLAVPNGSPEDLLAYVAKLRGVMQAGGGAGAGGGSMPAGMSEGRPRPISEELRTKLVRAMIEAGGRILAAKPSDHQAEEAFQIKLGGLSYLVQSGDAVALAQVKAFPAELLKVGRPAMAHMASGIVLQIKLDDAAKASPEEMKKILDEVRAFVGAKPLPSDVELAMMAIEVLEARGEQKQAADVCRDFAKAFAASDHLPVKAMAGKLLGVARRLTLVGNKIELLGTYLDGKPVTAADFQNKVLLVMFWATWCGPCRAEIPDVKAEYQLYHAKGFDVLGISLDTDREALEGFVKEQALPWRISFGGDPQQGGAENPMADHYGVMGIPTLFLVGKDGRVVSTEVRGKLHEELETLLGPATK